MVEVGLRLEGGKEGRAPQKLRLHCPFRSLQWDMPFQGQVYTYESPGHTAGRKCGVVDTGYWGHTGPGVPASQHSGLEHCP